jgi:catechol 2,3-dioxygenase-like lactoylglutathione lyase family enzyme
VSKVSKESRRPSVHFSINVPNREQGLRFYGEVFGFVENARPFPTIAILDATTSPFPCVSGLRPHAVTEWSRA